MTTDSAANTGRPLDPPPGASELELTPADAVGPVTPSSASKMVPLDEQVLPELDEMVDDYVASIVALDRHSPEFDEKAESIRSMGDADIRAAAAVSNRLLDSPVRRISRGGSGYAAKVSSTLVELRRQVEDLDPAKASGARKLLGIIPFGDKMREYFHRYESAQTHINSILRALYEGQDELRKDNAALEQEKMHLWETMQRLTQYVYVAEQLDASLSKQVREIEVSDRERAKVLQEDVLFYVRQKHQDLLTQLAVSIQGYLAMDLVRRNNIELIKGVDRASTTTIAALRTAVIVAQALANQKLVLDQITSLNSTTSDLIEATSKLIAHQSASINEQAASSAVSVDKLEAAFTNIYQTMDAIETFKVQALGSMQRTIDALSSEITKSQAYLDRSRRADAGQLRAADELQIPERT